MIFRANVSQHFQLLKYTFIRFYFEHFFRAPFGIFVQDNNSRNFNFRRRIPTHLSLFMYEFTQNTMDISHEIPMKVEIKSVSSFNGNLFEFVLFFIFGQFQMRSILIQNVYFAIFFSRSFVIPKKACT